MVETRVILGCRETPQFVKEEFFHVIEDFVKLYSQQHSPLPRTVRYYIPDHFVINPRKGFKNFHIDVDDENHIPICEQFTVLSRLRFKHRIPRHEFDRMTVVTEERTRKYFMLLPNSRFHHTTIYNERKCYWLLYDGIWWTFHFRQVYTDPHDLNHNIWYFSKPKYQIEINTQQDFRGRDGELKKALFRMMPRAFRWE